jgi:hypothetical protein
MGTTGGDLISQDTTFENGALFVSDHRGCPGSRLHYVPSVAAGIAPRRSAYSETAAMQIEETRQE